MGEGVMRGCAERVCEERVCCERVCDERIHGKRVNEMIVPLRIDYQNLTPTLTLTAFKSCFDRTEPRL